MLPKQYRLDPKSIPLIARKGQRIGNEFLDIRYLAPQDSRFSHTDPKFTISISTKVSKSAVVRNRIRRRLRPAIVDLISQAKIRPGKYLFITKSADLQEIDCYALLSRLFS